MMDKIGLLVIPGAFFGGLFLVKKCFDEIFEIQDDIIKAQDTVIATQDTLINYQSKEIEMLKQQKESQEKKS